jgi:hypothetical protein
VGDSFGSAWWRGYAAQLKVVADARRPDALAIMSLSETLTALGRQSESDEGVCDAPLEGVVGTVARGGDFDRQFRPRNRALRERWEALARTSADLPPVRLVRLGDMYFVEDGHHRVALARARGSTTVRARVRRICTVAWALRCLTVADVGVEDRRAAVPRTRAARRRPPPGPLARRPGRLVPPRGLGGGLGFPADSGRPPAVQP